jgi:hypothetical protein
MARAVGERQTVLKANDEIAKANAAMHQALAELERRLAASYADRQELVVRIARLEVEVARYRG